MRPLLFAPFLFSAAALAQSTPVPAPDGHWSKQQLTDNFWAEGCAVADFNKDGKTDVIYGPYLFAGPDFVKRTTLYDATRTFKTKGADGAEKMVEGFPGAKSQVNEYSDNFLNAAYDFNGDGWTDYLVMGFPGKETFWYENPKGAEGFWKRHTALDVTDNESPTFVDINGDKQSDLLCMSQGFVGYATFNPAKPTEKWTFHPISPKGPYQRFTHGIGYGDVNGDGRVDVLELKGWWEQPAKLDGDPAWTFHAQQFGVQGGAHMYVYDVNKDGRNDVITSLGAHDYGLAWYEQTATGWEQHLITGTPRQKGETGVVFAQLHAIELADMNGDGVLDIVTGKRFWAHGPKGDAEPNAPAVVWWFELKRDGGKATFIPHLIDGDSGTGTQFCVRDVNGDGKPDVITGNKRGAHVLFQK